MKKQIIFIIIFFLSITNLFGLTKLPMLYLRQIEYKGSSVFTSQLINKKISTFIEAQNILQLNDSEKGSDYVLSGTFTSKQENLNEEYSISLEIVGLTINKMHDIIVKKASRQSLVDSIIEEAVLYMLWSISPVETYTRDNLSFLTGQDMNEVQREDVVDRTRRIIRNPEGDFFTPTQENLYKKYNLQLQIHGGISIPVNLLEYGAAPVLFIDLPFQFYIFSTELISASLIINSHYNLINKQISLEKYNSLHVFGIGGGAGIAINLPFFRQVGFHCNLTGGYAFSFLVSGQNPNMLVNTGDPYFYPSLTCEYDITDRIILSVICSYLWVVYSGENLHTVQAGIGIGYRM